MKYLTDQFDLTMVYLSKITMIRCKRIRKEEIPIGEVISIYEDDFTKKLFKRLFGIVPRKNNIHIMLGKEDVVYYVKYIGPKREGVSSRIKFYEITIDDTECSMCTAKGTIDCKKCGKMGWISGAEL